MKGDSLTAFALNETDSIDLSKMTTTADLSKDTKEYVRHTVVANILFLLNIFSRY